MIPEGIPPLRGGAIDPEISAFLTSGQAFGGERPSRRIDTHAASIFLTATRAWKLKRPVNLGYLDFSTIEARHAALVAEDRLNRRTAPGLYHGVRAITRDGHDELSLDGPGTPVDWLLEMERFPDDALLSDRAARGRLEPGISLALGDSIARFHGMAEIVLGPGAARRFQKVADANRVAMARYPDQLDPERTQVLGDRISALGKAQAARLEARGRRGHVRRCHGDLHLANIALIDGKPTPFDCLEFDDELATTDVLYDLGFLLMDLWHRDLPVEANLVANRYLDLMPAEEDAIGLLPLFMAVRAQVRAHVAAARSVQGQDRTARSEAAEYLLLAEKLLEPVKPSLVAIGGLSGTGKSTVARQVAGALGRPPGARILRSDVLRKQRAGLLLEVRLPPGAYTPAERRAVYADLMHHARLVLSDGQAVIADAVFADEVGRAAIAAVAAEAQVDFSGIWLDAPEDMRAARVASRGPDPSDATPAVVHAQGAASAVPPVDWIAVSAVGTIDEIVAEVRSRLNLDLFGPDRPAGHRH
ncbi:MULTISPECIES: bifunctional aminoglycoside phosphotransferase/ATP-binding protein [unclassified Sphingomonas]|uniref:bifunctional aminoglycoside phosphotransferase/ATP-binding protein n=1 Tax=unclassified Sphingomonas TaxID=196159 RepID=UPI0006FB0C59|nr:MULTISPECIES: bifunctional aminoglycoside phosphotransferase/ATP-binding protein [unclassified Sphingomonas]KQX23289.1 hypothetical protein ASD17_02945 [Sphingomonas sp. Root1294]KQY68137.1 hypothetical protein ASD39_05465 [Sphingomonas sp. Root50]KRB91030.1 hypothetical protein ASE22_12260 [Sphingomonas sp. Root720]